MRLATFSTGVDLVLATARVASSYRDSLRSFRAWCDCTGRDVGKLRDEDLAEWVQSTRLQRAAIKLTLSAVVDAYASVGKPSPIGESTAHACRQLAAPKRQPRNERTRISA